MKHQPSGDVWLTLTPRRPEPAYFQQLDAVFRQDERLPYAMRVIDVARCLEIQYVIEQLRTGDEAIIPADTFAPPRNPLISSTDHQPLTNP